VCQRTPQGPRNAPPDSRAAIHVCDFGERGARFRDQIQEEEMEMSTAYPSVLNHLLRYGICHRAPKKAYLRWRRIQSCQTSRIDAEFSAVEEKAKHFQAEQMEKHKQRQARLEQLGNAEGFTPGLSPLCTGVGFQLPRISRHPARGR
jgi:hypothetical protein